MDVSSLSPRRSPHLPSAPRIFNAGNALPQQFSSPVRRIGSPQDAQIRDAEMSVEFLCQKYETFSEQLRREESAREEAERRSAYLASEVQSAEADAAKRLDVLTSEISGNDACLAALRSNATATSSRATLEAEKAREEKNSEAHLEKQGAEFSERCKSEGSKCEVMVARLTAQNSEVVQERCEHETVGRRLRQVQADTRVSLEDLRIAQMRALLVQSELQTLEASLDNMSRMRDDAVRGADTCAQQLQEKSRQLNDRSVHLQSLAASREAMCSEVVMQERRMAVVQEETRTGSARCSALQQELQVSQQELQMCSNQLHVELEATNTLTQELKSVERQRVHDIQEVAIHQRSLSEAETALEMARKNASERRVAKDTAMSWLEQLAAEEEGHGAAASDLRRARHAEDIAFDDIQSELQIAFKRRESLGEDLALRLHAREQLLTRLRYLRPEVAEAEERCRAVEEQLAQRAGDVEAEIAQQRRYCQEMSVVSDSIYEVQRQEVHLEAQLHHSLIFPFGNHAANVRHGVASPVRSTCSTSRNFELSQPRVIGDLPLPGIATTPRGNCTSSMLPSTPRGSRSLVENRQTPASRIGVPAACSHSPHRSTRHRGAAPAPRASPAPRLRASSQSRYRYGGGVGAW